MIKVTSLLDLKGLVMNSYHTGDDPDAIEGGGLKPWVATPGYALSVFLTKFYDEALKICGSPLNMIAALDDGNTYRKSIYPLYKANRAKIEKDPVESEQIELAIKLVKQFLLSQGVTLVGSKGEEADDVIGYLCKHLEGAKTVHTVDRDLVQLGDDKTFIFIDGRNVTHMVDKYTSKGQRVELEIPPNLVILYKSLIGDSSDGFGGVKGVGPAAWIKMVDDFGIDGMEELDGLIAGKEKTQIKAVAAVTKNKPFIKIAEDYDNWQTMYKVARISPEIVKARWIKRAPCKERLEKTLTAANCMEVYDKYLEDTYRAVLVTKDNLEESMAAINELLVNTPFVPWDYETWDTKKIPEYMEVTSDSNFVDVMNSEIAGCSFAFGRNVNVVYYFSVNHLETNNLDKSVVLDVIKLVEGKKLEMIAQNVQFEGTITKNCLDHDLRSWEDTKLYAHHVDENLEHGLKKLSKRHLNYDQMSYAATLEEAGATNMAGVTGEGVLSYGADDSLVTGHLYQHFLHLTSIEGTRQFISDYECNAVHSISNAYISGAMIDLDAIARMKEEDRVTMEQAMSVIRGLLSEHAKEPNFEAMDEFFEDQADYYRVKAKLRDNSTTDTVAESMKTRKVLLKQNCFYEDLQEVPNFKPWIPTVVQFNTVAGYLGLPKFEKVSRPGIEDWLQLLTPAQADSDFALLIPPAHKGFSKRDTPEYLKLREYCTEVLTEFSPKKVTGTELNMNSPTQCQYLMYMLLGLPVKVRTKVDRGSTRDKYSLPGSPSTDAIAIETAMANHCENQPWKRELLENLLDYKAAATRTSNYWNTYPLWVAGENRATGSDRPGRGLVHPGFNSCGTVTRRPTGSRPNFLQISKGPTRDMVIPRHEDNVIVSIDFASQELRLNADACQDPTWLSAYTGEKPKDLHALTGCRVIKALLQKKGKTDGSIAANLKVASALSEGKSDHMATCIDESGFMDYDFFKANQEAETKLGELIRKARSIGKTVNFSAQFGAQKATLSRNLLVPEDEAEEYLIAYNATFPELAKWKKRIVAEARVNGYAETSYGSRRHCPGIKSKNGGVRARWERQVINFTIQGTAADILKIVLTNLSRCQLLEATESYLLAPIYDEVLCEVPRKNLKEFLDGMCELMSLTVPGGTVPMLADCSFGPTWGQQIEVGNRPTQAVIDKALAKMDQ